jgi:RNA polymerase sigma-70 factor, ECF subfamily
MTEREFAEIVRDTKRVVLSSVGKHLPARFSHVIDDVVQETYLRAYRGLVKGKFRGDSALGSWLYTIAKNESYRMAGRLVREEEKAKKAGERMSLLAVGEYESLETLRIGIARLPEKYRLVMEMGSAGMSESEIAKELSIRKGTVKSRLSRGRDLLYRLSEGGDR